MRKRSNKVIPRMIDYPQHSQSSWDKIPLGVGEDGEVVWDTSATAHMSISGFVGTGKSMVLRNIFFHCLQHSRKWDLYAIDLTQVGLQGISLEDEGVQEIATTRQKSAMVLNFIVEEMHDRYEQMKAEGVSSSSALLTSPKSILLLINEAKEFLDATLATPGERYLQSQFAFYINEIVKLGRAVGIHVVLSAPRPTIDYLGGETKKNIGARYVLGKIGEDNSFALLETDTAAHIDGSIKGRGVLSLCGDEQEVQTYFCRDGFLDEVLCNLSQDMQEN